MLMKYSLEYKHIDSPVKEINLLVKTLKKEQQGLLKKNMIQIYFKKMDLYQPLHFQQLMLL